MAPSERPPGRTLLVVVVAAGLLGVFVLVGVLAAAMTLFVPLAGNDPQANSECEPVGTGTTVSGLTSAQQRNAQTIIETGKDLDVPQYGWVVALATALQESGLRNIGYGDRDSVGLFQQRDSWGPRADRMDPELSTEMFYTGGQQGQPGLLDIDSWEQLPVTEAAQAVQRSAFPYAYADDEPLARELVAAYAGGSGGECGPPAAQCPPTPWQSTEAGLTPDALLVLRCSYQKWPQFETFHGVGSRPAGGDGDHAAGRAVDMMVPFPDYESPTAKAFGWKVADWLRDNRERLGIKYLIWDKQIWSVARQDEGWREYSHYAGCTTDTCLHRDHIHVSVYGDSAQLPSTGDWTLPVAEGTYQLTAKFGDCSGTWASCHTGLDFAAPTGTPVRAAAAGEVVAVRRSDDSYGNYVKVDHGNGVVTMYAHLSAFAPGVENARVRPGMMIGEVGSTGNSSGPHLHFEVRVKGIHEDPERWLEAHGVDP